jgi:hypothetical protein
MTLPLYTFVYGDSLGLILLVDAAHTIDEVATRAQRAASMRVAPSPAVHVYHGDRRLDPTSTVVGAGLGPLDRIDIVPERGRDAY